MILVIDANGGNYSKSHVVKGNNEIANEGCQQEVALDCDICDSSMISSGNVIGGGQLAKVGVGVSPCKGYNEKPSGNPMEMHLGSFKINLYCFSVASHINVF